MIRITENMKSKKEEIVDGATLILSHKCSDRCKSKNDIIKLSNGKDDPIVKKTTDIKCKKDKKQCNTEPDLSAIFSIMLTMIHQKIVIILRRLLL